MNSLAVSWETDGEDRVWCFGVKGVTTQMEDSSGSMRETVLPSASMRSWINSITSQKDTRKVAGRGCSKVPDLTM